MDTVLLVLGFLCVIVGVCGSFLPVLPGLPVSWLGLLLLHLIKAVPMNVPYLVITGCIAVVVLILDYIIPAVGTKRFGGSKYGVYGTTIGLVIGLIAPIPFGFIIGPFVGAFVGEMIYQNNSTIATKAAFGSFLGFLTSSFMKLIVSLVFVGLFAYKVLEYREVIF